MNLADTVPDHLEGDSDEHAGTSETNDSPIDGTSLSTDDVFHILQTRRRRDVLRYLQGTTGPVRMREIAEQVAAWEQETTVDDLSSTERQRVYISLYQSHLPKLDEEGIVDYDKDRGLVERLPVAAQFDPYLDEVVGESPADERDPWPERYAIVLAAGLGLQAVVAVEALPFLEGVPTAAGGLLALVGIAAVVVAHASSR